MIDIELNPGEKREIIFDSISPWEQNTYEFSFNYSMRSL